MFTTPDLLDADATAAVKALGLDDPAAAELEAVGYPLGSPATAALYRVRGPRGSLFCKVLQHVRHWPSLQFMPPHLVPDFVEQLPWRAELVALGAAGGRDDAGGTPPADPARARGAA